MDATLLGTTGSWGIDDDETGMIIEGIDDDNTMEIEPTLDRVGNVIGTSNFNETQSLSISAKIPVQSVFTGKIAADLTLTNTVSIVHLQASSSGRVITENVKRSRGNKAYKMFEIQATHYLNMGADATTVA